MERVRAGVLPAVTVGAVMLVSCTGSSNSPAAPPVPTHNVAAPPVSVVAKTLSLGSGESFAAPTPNARPRLTATQAWVAYATRAGAHINRNHVPSGTTARLGVFTDGGGRRHLAYGYFTPNSAPAYTGPVVPSPPVLCTQWTMLSAKTGVHLESSWFRCPATHYVPATRDADHRTTS